MLQETGSMLKIYDFFSLYQFSSGIIWQVEISLFQWY